ncbi:hypothetical protein [Micromonospora sp. NPDC049374]|uniref:hypothetical protein n=1 Tax=Micromonospora sp. NPDC049374 TaxID=3154352 RepID=UPI00342EA5BB
MALACDAAWAETIVDVGCGNRTFRELRRRERTVLVTGLERSSTVVLRFCGLRRP